MEPIQDIYRTVELCSCGVKPSPPHLFGCLFHFILSVCNVSFKCIYYSSSPMQVAFLFWVVIGGAVGGFRGVCLKAVSPWSCLSLSCSIVNHGVQGPGLVHLNVLQ